jgi:hypothetical protein
VFPFVRVRHLKPCNAELELARLPDSCSRARTETIQAASGCVELRDLADLKQRQYRVLGFKMHVRLNFSLVRHQQASSIGPYTNHFISGRPFS